MRLLFSGIILGVTLALPLAGQSVPTVVRDAEGRSVYVLGLRRWTVGMLQDSLRKYAPTVSLHSHACAAVLRYTLGFADASAVRLRSERQPDIVLVHVREPQDSGRVHYRLLPLDSLTPAQRWLSATTAFRSGREAFDRGASAFLASDTLTDSLSLAVKAFLQSAADETTYAEALATLDTSPNYQDRIVATLVVANHPNRTTTWSALLRAIRESDGPVKSYAARVLRAIAKRSQAPDWEVLAPQVHAILDGTSLFFLDAVVEVLNARPEIGPAHARAFLTGGGEMLLNRAHLDQPLFARSALRLLTKLRGEDLGSDATVWTAWVASLQH